MILYHFTDFAKIEGIAAEGLRHDLCVDTAPPYGVVWLTRSEIPNWVTDPRPDSIAGSSCSFPMVTSDCSSGHRGCASTIRLLMKRW
jgi:hypothetical protein